MIPSTKLNKSFYKKHPKLSELHQHLYGFVPENLHDALIDTKTCLACFVKMTTNMPFIEIK